MSFVIHSTYTSVGLYKLKATTLSASTMPPSRIFLTGEPGCGKTTAINEIHQMLAAQGWKVGGVVSGELRERGVRVGFSLEDLSTHETGTLAHIAQRDGPTVGKYHVNLADIQRIAVTGIKHAILEADVIMVDELGPMELNSMPFILAVEMALATPKHLVGTIHKRASHYLVAAIKSNPAYQILEVTPNNRNELPKTVTERIESQM
ncbi:MAG: NTPase [Candidatus Bathyarchaeia archaeon]|jgi:nucleoside-triphosphatase